MMALKLTLVAAIVTTVAGHGSMITPAPRSAHGQVYDSANKCSCKDTGDCYSNITEGAQYCGVGCLGEACLYYQIGCYAGCGVCSMSGKDLFPTAEDLQLAGNCVPIEPTLPVEFRSYNLEDESTSGDWTKVNPWRAPGTAGRGNPAFQPCGVNSGWASPQPVRGNAGPPAGGQPLGANGTGLSPVGAPTVWQAGKTAEVEFSIYANHAGGYAYRLCKATSTGVPTEECFQAGHLEYASDTTKIVYKDGSKAPFTIPARTVSNGTWPTGSQWRMNPIPMCNCDQGAYCKGADDEQFEEPEMFHRRLQGKTCKAVTAGECGTDVGVNTCLKCGKGSTYDCEQCCPGCEQTTTAGYTFCECGKGPKPSPPPPSPPGPPSQCEAVFEEDCGAAKKQGTSVCDNCLKSHWAKLLAAGCEAKSAAGLCSGKGPAPAPASRCDTAMETTCGAAKKQGDKVCDNCLKSNWAALSADGCDPAAAGAFCGGKKPPSPGKGGHQFTPYTTTHFRPGQTSASCPTGLMFNSSWDEGVGSGPDVYGSMPYSMTDTVKVPSTLGRYILSWRWDCEQTPQVWNSCADIVIE